MSDCRRALKWALTLFHLQGKSRERQEWSCRRLQAETTESHSSDVFRFGRRSFRQNACQMPKLRVNGALARLMCYSVKNIVDLFYSEGLPLKGHLGLFSEELPSNYS